MLGTLANGTLTKLVPWHYPFVMLAAGTPLFVVPGILKQLFVRQWDRAEVFLLMSSVWPLLVFAALGYPSMMDSAVSVCCARLVIFSLLEDSPTHSVSTVRSTDVTVSAVGLIVTLFSGDAVSPFAVKPIQRARWSRSRCSATWAGSRLLGRCDEGEFWKQVPEGSTVYVAPVLHNVQLTGLEAMTQSSLSEKIRLEAFRYDSTQQKDFCC